MNRPPHSGIDLRRPVAQTAGNSVHKTRAYNPADRQYLAILEEMGAHLKPRNYLEIGTFRGASLAFFDCEAVTIDPDFHLQENYRPRSSVRIYTEWKLTISSREWNRDGRIVEELRNMWCGDVWKLLYCLKEHRPDLKRAYIDCQPSGYLRSKLSTSSFAILKATGKMSRGHRRSYPE